MMKKLMCVILAVILAMMGTAALAADADPNQKTALMIIRGEENDDPAPVYEDKEGTKQADLLKPGQFLGLIKEYPQGGQTWYQVIYMDADKKGVMGYLNEDAAEVLTLGKLYELMQNPVKANELMDLLDAVNTYLKSLTAAENTAAGSGDSEGAEGIAGFLKLALNALKEITGLKLGGVIEEIGEKGKEALGNLSDAMKKVLNTVRKGLGKAIDNVSEKIQDAEDKIVPPLKEAGSAVIDAVREAVESGKDFTGDAKDKAKEIIKEAGDKAEELIDKMKDKAEELYPTLSDDIKALVDGTLDVIEQVKDKIAETDLDDLKQAASDMWDDAKEKATDAAEEVSDKIGEAVDKARELLESDEAEEAIDRVKGYVDIAKAFAESFKESAEENGFRYAVGETLELVGSLLQIQE